VSDLVRRLDAGLPVYRVATLDAHQDEVLGAERSLATLVGLFALMAVLLAAVGLYGSLSYAVSRRTRELGIRMAVGAAARDVRMLVLRQGLWLAAAGTALGLAGALAVTRLIRGFLFGVSPTDPATLAAVAVLLLGVAAAASYVPAARATRVDPMEALRTE
jgi:ABC-type antimicrobial peptide transport system permease subunit